MEIIFKFWTVTFSDPIWPDIFFPFQTLPGVWHWPIDPGALWDKELPWVASCIWKFHLLTVPAKPFPFDTPETSTTCPSLNNAKGMTFPISTFSISVFSIGNSHKPSPGSTEDFLKCPNSDLVKCFSFFRPVVTWTEL